MIGKPVKYDQWKFDTFYFCFDVDDGKTTVVVYDYRRNNIPVLRAVLPKSCREDSGELQKFKRDELVRAILANYRAQHLASDPDFEFLPGIQLSPVDLAGGYGDPRKGKAAPKKVKNFGVSAVTAARKKKSR